jgi:osmotically-inducible protein OsmY
VIPPRFDDLDVAEARQRAINRTDQHANSDQPDDAGKTKQLSDDIRLALLATGQMWLRDVVVAANANGRVVLQGRVPSYYLKQLAQSAVLAVVGVNSVENQIAVQ